MNWSRPVDIKAQVQRMWDRGELLASLLAVEPIFPKRLSFKCPTSAEVADHFDEVRVWIGEFKSMPHCRLEKREIRHRVHGSNSVPLEAWIDSLDAAIDLISKKRDVARFKELIDTTRQRAPTLLAWLDKRPLQALELTEDWSRLLDIVVWRQAHSHPGVYLRQVDIAGVHSKFIEAHRVVLSELLDLVLPLGEIDASAIGASQFARRYQYRDKPMRIRFRVLDPSKPMLRGCLLEDITLDATNFARLDAGVRRYSSPRTKSIFSRFHRSKRAWSFLARATDSRCFARPVGCRVAAFITGATSIPTALRFSINCEANSALWSRFSWTAPR